jgi:hypothetical protein
MRRSPELGVSLLAARMFFSFEDRRYDPSANIHVYGNPICQRSAIQDIALKARVV